MKKRQHLGMTLFLFVAFLVLSHSSVHAETFTIGVVKDGDSYFDQMIPLIKEELKKHIKAPTTVDFKISDEFNADWKQGDIRSSLQAALDDSDVNVVLVTGPLATQEAIAPSRNLTKPVLSSFVQMSDIFVPSYTEKGESKKENMNFILVPNRIVRDIKTFVDMTGARKVDILLMDMEKDFIEFLKNQLPKYEEKIGIDLEFVVVNGDDIAGSLNDLDGSEGAYLTFMPQLSIEQRKELISEINRRKIPSFSILGHYDVELGALAAQTPKLLQQVVRRIALNINELVRGTNVNELPAILPVDTSLMINGKTAAAIDYFPGIEVQISANIINSEFLKETGGNLTLQQAFKLSEQGNTSLSIKDSEVESAKQSKNIARSGLLPQAFLSGNYTRVDSDRADTLPTVSQELGTGTVTVSQVLFDDKTISDFRSSIRLYEGSREDREASRLDAMRDGGVAFLRYSLFRELYRIETDNLRVTEDNLELAKLRYEVGYSGKDEVFRWQAELYQRKQSLFDSKAIVEAQRIAFNQVLGTEQDKRWQPIRIDVDPDEFLFLGGKIRNIMKKNHYEKEAIRSFLIDLALENSPEVAFLDKSTEAQRIELGRLERRFYIPTFSANFSYTEEIDRSGPRVDGLDDDEYTAMVVATYPLFEGGGKYYEIKRAKSDLENLKKQTKLAQEIVEQNSRTVLRAIESSFPSIKFSLLSADSARKNLDIVQEKYSEGTVNVTDLLEAQNQSFVSDQNAAIALYSYLIDLVDFQRSISWFEDDKQEKDKKNFIDSLTKHIAASR